MPTDKRLYITLPLDFPDHPKVKPLTVEAKWAFVEMNIYSRNHGLDGEIPSRTALTMWSIDALTELVKSHPKRPLVLLRRGVYVLREYAEHQLTNAAIDKVRATALANGLKGGRPPKANPTETQPVSETKPGRNQSQESESEDLTTQVNNVSQVPQTPEIDWTKVSSAVMEHCGRECDQFMALRVIGSITGKAKSRPRNPERYVLGSIKANPFEIQQLIDEAIA